MTSLDTCCTLVPYFKVHEGQMESFKQLSGAGNDWASSVNP